MFHASMWEERPKDQHNFKQLPGPTRPRIFLREYNDISIWQLFQRDNFIKNLSKLSCNFVLITFWFMVSELLMDHPQWILPPAVFFKWSNLEAGANYPTKPWDFAPPHPKGAPSWFISSFGGPKHKIIKSSKLQPCLTVVIGRLL